MRDRFFGRLVAHVRLVAKILVQARPEPMNGHVAGRQMQDAGPDSAWLRASRAARKMYAASRYGGKLLPEDGHGAHIFCKPQICHADFAIGAARIKFKPCRIDRREIRTSNRNRPCLPDPTLTAASNAACPIERRGSVTMGADWTTVPPTGRIAAYCAPRNALWPITANAPPKARCGKSPRPIRLDSSR